MYAEQQSRKDRATSERLDIIVRYAYITDSIEKGIIGTVHRTSVFIKWHVIVPSGVTTRVHAASYQGTFSDFERF